MGDATMKNSRLTCSLLLCFKAQLVALWVGKCDLGWVPSVQFFHKRAWEAIADVFSSPFSWGRCWCVFLSPQLVNRHLYSGSADRTVKCWFVDTGERIQTYKAHKHSVSTLKYHAGICKLPFLCPPAPSSLLFNVSLWLKVVNGEKLELVKLSLFSNSSLFMFSTKLLHHSMWKLRLPLHFPPSSSHKWGGSCFVSVTKGSGLNPELSGGCVAVV